MNILKNLASVIKGDGATDELTPEQIEAQAKKDRIDFHRAKVRNGPVSFKEPTNGQLRRLQARATKRRMERAHQKQVRAYFDARREGATIRGHLESIGLLQVVLGRSSDWEINHYSAYRSTLWLVKHFADRSQVDARGRVILTSDLVLDSLRAALNRWQQIVGLPATELPEGYELPVEVAA